MIPQSYQCCELSFCTSDQDVKVQVSGFNVYVKINGYARLVISLPFAVSGKDADANLLSDEHLLVVRLPHRPILNLLSEVP